MFFIDQGYVSWLAYFVHPPIIIPTREVHPRLQKLTALFGRYLAHVIVYQTADHDLDDDLHHLDPDLS